MKKALVIFYVVMAIATYGNAFHEPSLRYAAPSERATAALLVAPFWPLYWSTVLFEP